MKPKIVLIIIGVLTLLALGFWRTVIRQKQIVKSYQQTAKSHQQITIRLDKDSVTHAEIPVVETPEPVQVLTQNYYTYVADTLAPALKIATEKIDELTRINAKLEGELRATRLELDENKAEKIYYESKYLSIITERDSAGNLPKLRYSYNAEINLVEFKKRKNWFARPRTILDISSPDPNFRINGVEHFRRELPPPSPLGLGVQVGYGMNENFRLAPYFGVGLNYQILGF